MRDTGALEKRRSEFSWDDFSRRNDCALQLIQKRQSFDDEVVEEKREEKTSSTITEDLLDYLFRDAIAIHKTGHQDLKTLKNVMVYIFEAKNRNLFSSEEARALSDYMASIFIWKSFEKTIKVIFPEGEKKSWFYSSKKILK
jgi:HD superfamily phosphohydrolase